MKSLIITSWFRNIFSKPAKSQFHQWNIVVDGASERGTEYQERKCMLCSRYEVLRADDSGKLKVTNVYNAGDSTKECNNVI